MEKTYLNQQSTFGQSNYLMNNKRLIYSCHLRRQRRLVQRVGKSCFFSNALMSGIMEDANTSVHVFFWCMNLLIIKRLGKCLFISFDELPQFTELSFFLYRCLFILSQWYGHLLKLCSKEIFYELLWLMGPGLTGMKIWCYHSSKNCKSVSVGIELRDLMYLNLLTVQINVIYVSASFILSNR